MSGPNTADYTVAPAVSGLGQYLNTLDNITALAGGTQTTSPALVYGLNRITVSANNTDGVVLPPAFTGAMAIVINSDAAQDIVVFGNGSDTIDGTAGATGVTMGEGTKRIFFALSTGAWYSIISA